MRKNIAQALFASFVFLPLWSATSLADSALDTQLLEAVQFSDTAAVSGLLAKGANANFVDGRRSLLGWAAQTENTAIVDALLAAKADPNFVDGVGHTPLMRAIETRQLKNVEALIKHKADVNLRTKDGTPILTMAVDTDNPEIVKAVLAAGANLKSKAEDGTSPALVAAQAGLPNSLEIIKILGAAKVDLNISNAAYTPLLYAVSMENEQLVSALLAAGANPNAITQSGTSAVHKAVANPAILRLLLNAKADPNLTTERGETVLAAAIYNGTPESVKQLIKAGVDVNKKDISGSTPLQLAGITVNPEIAEILKQSGAQE